jgi:hypothetical protein
LTSLSAIIVLVPVTNQYPAVEVKHLNPADAAVDANEHVAQLAVVAVVAPPFVVSRATLQALHVLEATAANVSHI